MNTRMLTVPLSILSLCFVFVCLPYGQSRADFIGKIAGGNAWREGVQNPIVVPVKFYGTFNSWLAFQVSLNGVVARETNDVVETCNDADVDPEFWTMPTPLEEAYLAIYKTYALTLSGDHVYSADASLLPPSDHDIETGRGQNIQRYHRYNLFIWNYSNKKWEKFCSENAPQWNAENCDDNPLFCQNGDFCVSMTKTWWIQVRPDLGARAPKRPGPMEITGEDNSDDGWNRSEDPIDAATAPGDGDVLEMQGGKNDDPASINFMWGLSMGRLWDGGSAGKVRIVESRLTTNTYTPRVLAYTSPSSDTNEVDVLRDLSDTNLIKQIKTPQTLMTVSALSSNSFEMKLYVSSMVGARDTNGFFTLVTNATNYASWKVDSSDGTTNKWRLQEIRNNLTNATQLEYNSSTQTWTLSRGTGSEARIETRSIVSNVVSGATNRIETQQVVNGAGTVSDKTIEVYQKFDWGYELVTVTNDPGGANLVTQFTYFTDPGDDVTHQQINTIVYPDGYWERRDYSYDDLGATFQPYGSLIAITHPWKDTPIDSIYGNCTVSSYDYAYGTPGSSRLQRWHDAYSYNESEDLTILGRVYSAVYEEETQFIEDDCSEPSITEEWRQFGDLEHYGEGYDTKSYGPYYPRLSGHIYSKSDKSGRLDSYDYVFGEWNTTNRTFTAYPPAAHSNDVRQIIYHGTYAPETNSDVNLGVGDSGQGIDPVYLTPFKTTKEVKIIDDSNLAARELYVYTGQETNFALIDQVIYQRDCLGHATNAFRVDPATLQTRVIYTSDWQGTNQWPADLKFSETDESGGATSYTYDSLKRLKTKTKKGASVSGYPSQADIVNSLDYDAASRVLTNKTSASGLSLITRSAYDKAGRITSTTPPDGLTTSYSYVDGGRQTNITLSSGATISTRNYLDRHVASITGTGVTNQFFDYSLSGRGIDDALYPKNVTTNIWGSTNSLRWTATVTDNRFKLSEERKPAFRSTNDLHKTYNFMVDGLLGAISESAFEDANGDPKPDEGTGFTYNFFVEKTLEGRDGPDSDSLFDTSSLATTDRVVSYANFYETNSSGHWFKVTRQSGYLIDNDATPTVLKTVKERLSGMSSNTVSETTTIDANTNSTVETIIVDLANKKSTKVTDIPESTLNATNIVLNGLLQTESTPSVTAVTWHYYDVLGRETSVQDPLGFTTSTAYDSTTGQVISKTDQFGQSTTYSYYAPGGSNAGMLYCETGPTGKKTYYKYNDHGQVIQKWGDVPYPEQRLYSQFGEMTNQVTYRAGSGWNGSTWPTNTTGTGDVTKWFFDEPTGLLTNKTDASNQPVTYSYYNNWTLKTRTWARGVTSTNLYSDNGDLLEIDYSDGTTSLVYTNHDRRALPRTVIDSTGTRNLSYDAFSRVTNDKWTNGVFSGLAVSNHFHQYYGRDFLKFTGSPTTIEHDYSYDTYGRMSGASYGVLSGAYGYLANSDLLQTTTDKNNGSTVLTTTRNWEYGSRLQSIVNLAGGSAISSHAYSYDALQRRMRATLADGSAWAYDYDDHNELVFGKRYWPDFSPVFGQQYEYAFDNIGNRTTSRFGGDSNGANLRSFTYTANSLNQYSGRTVPGYLEVIGAAQATATSVTVNGAVADNRKVEYFAKELSITNGSGPVWQGVTAIATLGANSTTNSGNVLVPPTTQNFNYDADGDLTNDTVWVYKWDAENRLTQMTNLTTVSTNARKKVVFTYDHLGRRATKKVYLWASTDYSTTPVADERCVYDGWNLIAELNATNNAPIRSYLWGRDLSGTINGAGGIGGLMLVTDHAASTYHFAAYDGNGNITALEKTDGTTSANYEYDPFGQTIRITGSLAKPNPFRFSTKFTDDETDLIYYGCRYYHPGLGRWINRDPIAEDGGNNLYAFVLNNPTTGFDAFGMAGDLPETEEVAAVQDKLGSDGASQAINFYHRVKNMVDNFNDLQEFMRGVLDSTTGDFTDIFAILSQRAKDALTTGDTHGHHTVPLKRGSKDFADAWAAAGIDPNKFMINMDKFLHGKIHGRGGGKWNKAYEIFLKLRQNPRAERIMGFTFSMLYNIGKDAIPFL